MDENLIEHVAKALYHSMSDMKPREFPTGREWEGVRWDAVSAIKAMQSYKHSLPGILKIQGDANILLDGINSIELFDDEIRYDGKTIYRGKYKRGEERDIIAKYTEAQRNKHRVDPYEAGDFGKEGTAEPKALFYNADGSTTPINSLEDLDRANKIANDKRAKTSVWLEKDS